MRYTIALVLAALPSIAGAQVFPVPNTTFALNSTTYTQDFNTLAATGATGTALPTGFQVAETGSNANTSYGVGTGSSNTGNSYSFGSTGSSDRALGSVGSGSITQVLFGGVFTNALGATITDLAFAYTGEQWRLSNSRDDGLTFQYLIGATGITGNGWTTVTGLNFAPLFDNGTATGSALNGNLAVNQRDLAATLSGLTLLDGQTFGFRWVDVNSPSSDQGLAVDDLSITATTLAGAVPEPATWAMMIGGVAMAGGALRRRRRSTVSFA